MQDEAEVIYELWEEGPPVFRPHSRLYHLEPVGMGSPLVESLTSYLTRLADAHSVHPRTLVTKEILPLANISYLYQDSRPVYDRLTAFWKDSAALNGTAPVTKGFVQALEHLTQRDDLHCLTMLSWREVISHRALMRRTRAWCSMCYEEWRQAGQTIYHPLLWAFECVTLCPRHDQQLQQRCPSPDCARTQLLLAPRGLPGHCMWCNRWLGGHFHAEGEGPSLREDEAWQRWVGSTLGELLAAAPRLSAPPPRSKFATAMAAYLNDVAEGSIAALARRLHVGRRTVQDWLQGLQIPQSGTLVQLCAYLETSPLRLLTGSAEEAASAKRHISFCEPPSSEVSRRRLRKLDTTWLRSSLEEILQNMEEPPPSMREVGQRLAYDPSVLLKYFPDLCGAISARYLEYQHNRGAKRRQKVAEEVRQAVYTLHGQGNYPSQRQVRRLLRTPGAFREDAATATWSNAMRELGLQ